MKTVVMTGGTSGLGEYAAQQIFQTQGIRLLLGARGAVRSKIETLPLDLARLKSVREFAEAVTEKLGDAPMPARSSGTSINEPKMGLKRLSRSISSLTISCCGSCFQSLPRMRSS
jgi:NAD(P)-dependent dehydrogenase (short-subunit alcohol dehydrogenase family)